jgi:hypothetical protein
MSEIKFVIIANPRTGTNHFIDLLNSHQDITCHREVFHRDAVYILGGSRNDLLEKRDLNPVAFMEELYNSSPTRACGFKIFAGHNATVLDKVLHDPAIKKIILYRPNFLAVYSSEKIAEAESRYLIMDEKFASIDAGAYDSSRTSKLAFFDQADFSRRWAVYQEYYKYALDVLNETEQMYLFMTYEDFINDSFFRRIFSFLGLPQPKAMHTRMKKQNTSDILSRFQNPNEARDFIKSIGRMNWTNEGFMLWGGKEEK